MTPLLAQQPRADRAFERMYQRHAPDVYRYALAVLHNPSDAEDVTQTTFMNAYRAYQQGERPRAEQNWLIAIAHNVCRQRFRQSQRRPHEVAFEEDVAEAVVDEEAVSAEDIRRALSHLAFNQRAAVVMREIEGRSYTEIAQILGLSVSAVETLIFRARRALREQLEGGLSCQEAELAISKQLDRRLTRAEKGQLRAHLRECAECASLARSQRAQRSAWKALGAIPLPTSLSSFFGGGGGVAVGTGLAAKAAAVVVASAVVGGVGYEGAHHRLFTPASTPAKRAAVLAPAKQESAPGAKPSVPVSPAAAARTGPPTRAASSGQVPELAGPEDVAPETPKGEKPGRGHGPPLGVTPGEKAQPGQKPPHVAKPKLEKPANGQKAKGNAGNKAKGKKKGQGKKPKRQPLAPGVVDVAPPLPPELANELKNLPGGTPPPGKPVPKKPTK